MRSVRAMLLLPLLGGAGGCSPAYTMRTLPSGDVATVQTFVVPPTGAFTRFGDGWSVTQAVTPDRDAAPGVVVLALGDAAAPIVRLDARAGWMRFEVPKGGHLLPRDSTVRLIRDGLQVRGFSDERVEQTGISRALELLVPRELGPLRPTGGATSAPTASGRTRTRRVGAMPPDFRDTVQIDLRPLNARMMATPGKLAYLPLAGQRHQLSPADALTKTGEAILRANLSPAHRMWLEEYAPVLVRLDAEKDSRDPELAPIDLKPGFRLRVERAGLSMRNASSSTWWTSAQTLSGTGEAIYTLTTTPDGKMSFEPILAPMAYQVTDPVDNPALHLHVVALRADLDQIGLRNRYWRLVYPAGLMGASQFVPDAVTNPVLVGADSLSVLARVSSANVSDLCESNHDGAPYRCVIFAGRTVLLPEIAVKVGGERRFLSYGTTLRTLLQAQLDFAQIAPRQLTDALCRRLTLHRQYGARWIPVKLTMRDTSWLDLPLQHGDRISW